MLGFLRSFARKLKSTWAAFTSDRRSRKRVERDQGAPHWASNGENPKDEHVDRRTAGGPSGSWRIYAFRDRWGCGEHWENMLEDDDNLPRDFSFPTRSEAEAYRLARPWIHDAYMQDDVSGAVVPPLKKGYWAVNWPPGKEPMSWPPTPDDYEAARRYAMRDLPTLAGSPYEWVEVPWQRP